MKIALGADHRGFAEKENLKALLEAQGHIINDVGAHALDMNDDYPDFAYAAAMLVGEKQAERGILLCGSGMGMDIVANKVRGVRATIIRNTDEAKYARDHDDINVITLAADALDASTMSSIVDVFLTTPFSQEERHARRIEKLRMIENGDVFDHWNAVKKRTDALAHTPHVSHGDVVLIRMGKNIGFEQDGEGELFLRPVVVIKKYNQYVFTGVPLTTKKKTNAYYVDIGMVKGVQNYAIISQLRLFDAKRIEYFLGHIPKDGVQALRARIAEVILYIETSRFRGSRAHSAI
jgi:ribose 5-phosphate isomerase B